ncbi:MAG: SDR family oxidoreductase [Acetobacteraceae bacterium]
MGTKQTGRAGGDRLDPAPQGVERLADMTHQGLAFGGPHYAAAKAGVLGLAKAMAREFGRSGIRGNAVMPGLIQTEITGGKLTDEMRAEILKGIPIGRLGTAEDVARIFLFLASELSAYVTGAVIDVNGGMLIH